MIDPNISSNALTESHKIMFSILADSGFVQSEIDSVSLDYTRVHPGIALNGDTLMVYKSGRRIENKSYFESDKELEVDGIYINNSTSIRDYLSNERSLILPIDVIMDILTSSEIPVLIGSNNYRIFLYNRADNPSPCAPNIYEWYKLKLGDEYSNHIRMVTSWDIETGTRIDLFRVKRNVNFRVNGSDSVFCAEHNTILKSILCSRGNWETPIIHPNIRNDKENIVAMFHIPTLIDSPDMILENTIGLIKYFLSRGSYDQ